MTGSGRADAAAAKGKQAGREVRQNPAYNLLVTVGLICYGVVHLLIAWTAVQLAWGGGGGQEASSNGALKELAAQPFGRVLLVVVAVGLLTLVVWQVLEATIGHTRFAGGKRTVKRLSSVAKAVVYAALGVSAARTALTASSGGSSEETLTQRLMSAPAGAALVGLVGLVIAIVGVVQVVRGVRRTFLEDLDGGVSKAQQGLGVAGYAAKGITFVVVGGLFALAALTVDPEKAGGMDDALRTLREQPFGPYLLTVMAAGIACFGLYCFVWSKHAKRD